jgi:PIN domain nuclease of toxin-antitoxin system
MKEREEREESDREAIKEQITGLMEILIDVRAKSTYELQMDIREKVSRLQINQEYSQYMQKLMEEPEIPQIQQHHLRSRF